MSWIDLPAGDPEFYARLFGWTLSAGGVFTRGGRAVAGYGSPVPPGRPPAWTVHLPADDPDRLAARVATAGGRVETGPADTPLGRTAVLADPAGTRFAVREPGRPADVATGPFTPSWVELCTPDPAAARDFYAGAFGWAAVAVPMALPAGEVSYTVLCRDGAEQAGVLPAGGPFPPPGPARWLPYVEIPDCAATARAATAAGGTVVVPPLDIPRIGRVAVLAGCTGETLAVIEMPPAG